MRVLTFSPPPPARGGGVFFVGWLLFFLLLVVVALLVALCLGGCGSVLGWLWVSFCGGCGLLFCGVFCGFRPLPPAPSPLTGGGGVSRLVPAVRSRRPPQAAATGPSALGALRPAATPPPFRLSPPPPLGAGGWRFLTTGRGGVSVRRGGCPPSGGARPHAQGHAAGAPRPPPSPRLRPPLPVPVPGGRRRPGLRLPPRPPALWAGRPLGGARAAISRARRPPALLPSPPRAAGLRSLRSPPGRAVRRAAASSPFGLGRPVAALAARRPFGRARGS